MATRRPLGVNCASSVAPDPLDGLADLAAHPTNNFRWPVLFGAARLIVRCWVMGQTVSMARLRMQAQKCPRPKSSETRSVDFAPRTDPVITRVRTVPASVALRGKCPQWVESGHRRTIDVRPGPAKAFLMARKRLQWGHEQETLDRASAS
jgi:hypothetical protein